MMKKLFALMLAMLLMMSTVAALAEGAATPTDLAPVAEEPFRAFAAIHLVGSDELYYGDTVTLRADVSASEDRAYTLDWQYWQEDAEKPENSGWRSLGCSGNTYTFTLTESTAAMSFRVLVTFAD